MNKKISQIQTEKLLTKINEDSLDDKILDDAKDKVWVNLSNSIENYDITLSKDSETTNTNVFWSIFFNFQTNQIVFVSLVLLVSVFGLGIFGVSLFNNPTNNNPEQVAKLFDGVEPLPDTDDVRVLANARIEQVSGASFEVLEELFENQELTSQEAGEDTGFRVNTTTARSLPIIDEERVESLIQSGEIKQDRVNYSLVEKTAFVDDGLVTSTEEVWSSLNYYKAIYREGDIIKTMDIYTPEYNLSFRGGKYAIRQKYNEEQLYNGLYNFYYGNNFETEFLRLLLLDESIENMENRVIDGKEYQVFETRDGYYDLPKIEPAIENPATLIRRDLMGDLGSLTRYYVDPDTFRLYLTEEFYGDELVYQQKNVSEEVLNLDPEDMKDIFSYSEIGEVEIKEFNLPLNLDYDLLGDLENFVDKYNLLYLGSKFNISAYDYNLFGQIEYDRLFFNPDFDPSIDVKTDHIPVIAYYYFGVGNVNIYDIDPNNIYTDEYNQYEIQDVELQVGGQTISAKYYIYKSNNSLCDDERIAADVNSSDNSIEDPDIGCVTYVADMNFYVFQVGNLWYRLSLKGDFDLDSEIVLIRLSQDEAAEVVDYKKAREESYPELEGVDHLQEIEDSIRILPGDLSQDFRLELNSVRVSIKEGINSTCDQFEIESLYYLISCLVEKYDGFNLEFSRIYDKVYENPDQPVIYDGDSSVSNSNEITSDDVVSIDSISLPNYSNLNFIVLDQGFSGVDIQSLLDQMSNESLQIHVSEVGNGTKVSFNQGLQDLYMYPKGKKTILFLIPNDLQFEKVFEFTSDELIEVLLDSDFDKDIDILQSQIPKYCEYVTNSPDFAENEDIYTQDCLYPSITTEDSVVLEKVE